MKLNPNITGASTKSRALDEGRESLRKQSWASAFSLLSAADRETPLEPEDLEQLANAARLIGQEQRCAELLSRAHHDYLSRARERDAARCAFWLGFMSLLKGEMAQASGWLSRANRLLADQPECVETGYLLLPVGFRAMHEGQSEIGLNSFSQAAEIGNHFGDKDLVTLALQGQGRALIRSGEITRGVTLLDEAMVAVTAGEVSPWVAGGVYCSVIEGCGEIFDLRRAQEWTAALEQWCAVQPDIVPYRGHCRVRRAEILQLHGDWRGAMDEAHQACEWLSSTAPNASVGAAFYCIGELRRLRGEFAPAEAAYREAAKWDRTQPGFAQLRFVQGHLESANATIRRIADEVQECCGRARMLEVYVEIVLAAGDVPAARAAADEFSQIAERYDSPFLHAASSRATGAVLLAEHNARGALSCLKQSWQTWCELEAPYEAARTRILAALACRQLGDEDTAISELTAAREVFEGLDAAPDLARTDALLVRREQSSPLTSREAEVLRLVASGMTNRAIASHLNISEKTVARHLSNIFIKLDLSSRAAATAYAYQHDLV
jgi:DNA-binding CsgD family transcriptional regulator